MSTSDFIARMDRYVRARIAERPALLVPFFLMAGHGYEHLDRPLISDGLWDELCRYLDHAWDEIEHPHKALIRREHLSAGTAMGLTVEVLPEMVKAASRRLLAEGPPPGSEGALLPWYDARQAGPVLAAVLGWRLKGLDVLDAPPPRRPAAWQAFVRTSLWDRKSLSANGMEVTLRGQLPMIEAKYQPDEWWQVLAVGDDVYDAIGDARRWLDARPDQPMQVPGVPEQREPLAARAVGLSAPAAPAVAVRAPAPAVRAVAAAPAPARPIATPGAARVAGERTGTGASRPPTPAGASGQLSLW